jgi:hypothetical protein
MPTILYFDHSHYLIRDDVNINTLIKALEGARVMRMDYEPGVGREWYMTERLPQIEIKIVTKDQILDSKKLKRLPEKASPDCNGPMV